MSKSVVATQLAWWSSAIALPVVALQGRRLRRTIPRLPEAQGRNHGIVASDGDRLSITAIGESTVAGVGVTNHSEGIACRVAAQLCALAGREIAWHAIGMNGATIARVRQTLVSRIADHQAVVLVMVGVNDTLQLTSTAAWRREIDLLIGAQGSRIIIF